MGNEEMRRELAELRESHNRIHAELIDSEKKAGALTDENVRLKFRLRITEDRLMEVIF